MHLNTRSQLVCVWTTIVCLAMTAIGFFLVSGYVPPKPADASAETIARFYAEHTDRIRVGVMITFLSWAGWGTLVAAISTQMARIEGDRPVLTNLQTTAGAAGWVFLLLPTALLGAATFRPERSPEVTQTLHDLGWITAFIAVTPFFVQGLAIAAAIFQDESADPVFPRWFAYTNVWMVLLFLPGGLLLFFKTGAFSYQGLFVFWVPFVVFGAWILLLALMVRRAILREAAQAPG
jgi:hypothetical protein